MNATDELKPCPFCGGENLASNWHSPFIICNDCGAFGPGNADSTHEQAVKAWNTRTPEQAIAATLGGGECEVISHYYYDDYDLHEFELSCGHSYTMHDDMPYPFCPICGKKVKAVKR